MISTPLPSSYYTNIFFHFNLCFLFINNSICNVIREKLDDEDKEYKLNEFFSDIKNIPKEEYKYDPTNWHDYLKYYFKHNILIVVSSPTSNSLSPLFPFSIR